MLQRGFALARVVQRRPNWIVAERAQPFALLAIGWVLCFALPGVGAAQDDEGEDQEVEEVVVMHAIAIAPAGQAPDKDAPPEFLKSLVNAEISFIKRVCEPTDDQMKEIIAAATQAYQATGDIVREPNQQFFAANAVRMMGPGNEQLNENPYDRIRSDAAKYLKPIISKEQYARYETESQQRSDFERAAVVGIIVGLVDDKIPMTDPQREQMAEMLMQDVDHRGYDLQSIQVYLNNSQYLPRLPGEVVREVFNEKQAEAWNSQNSNVSFAARFNADQQMSIDEEWIE
ncbi:hypothetical protein CA85_46460 [Allorhodopirellula solitaria]|uniref:Uncharacterized protein n=2 Tax=Allorhodopirellula solitaria TaxID=2527987 RepID=A0A5C5WYL2_9BACT|nr:hypothetical protein CA85_46460 [Allorhodopirellula solitaria]